jgi:MinD superfamily P-loop ATPase
MSETIMIVKMQDELLVIMESMEMTLQDMEAAQSLYFTLKTKYSILKNKQDALKNLIQITRATRDELNTKSL